MRRRSAAAFSPLSLSPALWLKAGAGTSQTSGGTAASADGDPVGQWLDQSTNGRNPSQATSTKRATLKLNVLNGLPVLRFDGVDDFLRVAFGSTVSQPTTVFLVGKLTGGQAFFDGATAATHLIRALGVVWGVYAGVTLNSVASSDANFHILQATFNGASSKLRVGGGSAVASGDAGTIGMDGATVGAWGDGTNPMAGDVAEVIAYPAGLTTAQLDQVGGYLNGRYGLTWGAAT